MYFAASSPPWETQYSYRRRAPLDSRHAPHTQTEFFPSLGPCNVRGKRVSSVRTPGRPQWTQWLESSRCFT
ncbi:MAG: hypothetical protein A3K65_01440 [Euryarchaeota archaeon RBG_16_68_12]|nr:MAG: hypothetical protein A3K65_01440 [Euryarchaeota archaeon RBG_16_68_12]